MKKSINYDNLYDKALRIEKENTQNQIRITKVMNGVVYFRYLGQNSSAEIQRFVDSVIEKKLYIANPHLLLKTIKGKSKNKNNVCELDSEYIHNLGELYKALKFRNYENMNVSFSGNPDGNMEIQITYFGKSKNSTIRVRKRLGFDSAFEIFSYDQVIVLLGPKIVEDSMREGKINKFEVVLKEIEEFINNHI